MGYQRRVHGESAPGLLTVHMGGVLSSIPLCSRAKELQDVPELDLRPEEKPESPVTVTQPQPVSQTCIDNENHREKSVEPADKLEPVHNTCKVPMAPGVTVEISKAQKDELY